MKPPKILYGICGIGNGHTQRQLPLVEYFSKDSQIVIFAYDSSYDFYSKRFKEAGNVTVLEVAVPFYVGTREGLDFEATKTLSRNNKDYAGINARATAKAETLIGTPDLVISDYEPTSAQYSYAHDAPLVTIDQQSKYLTGIFPSVLHGQTYADEVARLKLFFPTAAARIACSFFDVEKKDDGEQVIMLPPILKESILTHANVPGHSATILVYFSSQKEFPQSLQEVGKLGEGHPDIHFHIFAPGTGMPESYANISFYRHGAKEFDGILRTCLGIITTAGHTLLSEAMHLGIPVYAIPLAVYEQQMNAEVIDANGFGIRSDTLNRERLEYFLSHIAQFRKNIQQDHSVLLKGDGKSEIIEFLEKTFLSKKSLSV